MKQGRKFSTSSFVLSYSHIWYKIEKWLDQLKQKLSPETYCLGFQTSRSGERKGVL